MTDDAHGAVKNPRRVASHFAVVGLDPALHPTIGDVTRETSEASDPGSPGSPAGAGSAPSSPAFSALPILIHWSATMCRSDRSTMLSRTQILVTWSRIVMPTATPVNSAILAGVCRGPASGAAAGAGVVGPQLRRARRVREGGRGGGTADGG